MSKNKKSSEIPTTEVVLPKDGIGDHIHAVVRAGISAIPVVGGPALELFNAIVASPLRKRQAEWMEFVTEGLKRLELKHHCILDDLKDNDVFIDTVMQASKAAVQTSNDEKRVALRNAVLNAALPNPPDDAKRQVFVNLIEQMTVWHLRILSLLADPPVWFSDNGKTMPQWSLAGSLSQLLTAAYPELQNQREFYDIIGKDLFQRGLLNTDGFHAMMSGQGALAKRTTGFADEFMRFIAGPLGD